jgi:hypothetical protein
MRTRSSPARNQVPYSDNFMVSIERELAPNTVATASYVGSRGHHMVVIRPNQSWQRRVVLERERPSQVALGVRPAAPLPRTASFTTASGQVINSTRTTVGTITAP